jgi:hypothetical protein
MVHPSELVLFAGRFGRSRIQNHNRIQEVGLSYGTDVIIITIIIIIISGSAVKRGLWTPRHTRVLDHTQRRSTVGRTTLGRVISSSQRPLTDNTQQTNIHALGGIRTHDRNRREAVDLRLRPRGCWDRHCI